jgi:hypothetical protein
MIEQTPEYNSDMSKAIEILIEQNKNIIEFDRRRQIKITDLDKLIFEQVKNGCKLFVIDHLHYFDM